MEALQCKEKIVFYTYLDPSRIFIIRSTTKTFILMCLSQLKINKKQDFSSERLSSVSTAVWFVYSYCVSLANYYDFGVAHTSAVQN